MKQKLFTLLTLLVLCVTGAWADEAILSWNLGTNGAAASSANSITGASGSAAEGFTIAISGNTGKSWSNGNGNITYNETVYTTLKNSNGAQNTVTCPAGKVATKVVFYVVTNHDDTKGKLSEFGGESCNDEVSSLKDYDHPTIITKNIDNKSSFTFTFSTKQVCFIAIVTYTDAAADVVANPMLTLNGNELTMSCGTTDAKIYYTLDGTEPTTESTLYSSAVTLENSCTVRAKAFNGASNEYSSEIVSKECYVTHTSALKVLGYNGGTVNGDVWTSEDGLYTLTNNVENRGIGYVNLAGTQDGFKLNHVDTYTIAPSSDIKISKIVVVGKTWLDGDASTIAFDGFTPTSGTFYEKPAGGETYVKTIEFTPTTEQTYGQAITMRPGTNQLGAYIEIYGVKRSGPADPVHIGGDAVTWDFSSSEAQTAAGPISENASNDLNATDGTSKITYVAGSDSYEASKKGYYINTGGSSGSARYFVLKISSNGSLGITSTGNNGEYVIKKAANSSTNYTNATNLTTITTDNNGEEVQGEIVYDKDNPYLIIGFAAKRYTQKITWTPASDNIELTTTDNMAGWRAFNPDGQGYTLDTNTKAFIVTAAPSDNKVTLVTLAEGGQDIPGNTPVILYTTSTADSHKMTLTAKAGVDDYTGTNLLKVTTAAQDLSAGKCRLGYGANGVGFYKYAVASAPAGIVYLDAAPAQEGKGFTFVFEGETTGISNLNVNDNANIDANAPMYNLAGQRVTKSYKGVVIVNGKKMLNK